MNVVEFSDSLEFEGREPIRPELNIAPLVDIVFLLLIFFMLSSTLISESAIEVVVPESESASQIEAHEVTTVALSSSGNLYLNGVLLEKSLLPEMLLESILSKPRKEVILKTDSDVSIQEAVDVMDIIKSAGASGISLSATRVEKK
jgi:biopolymer transport protein ExbD